MSTEASYMITPADGWYFIHRDTSADTTTVHRVAVWQQQPDGTVIGLLPVNAKVEVGATQRLLGPPPIDGDYVFRSDLTEEELASAGAGSRRFRRAGSPKR